MEERRVTLEDIAQEAGLSRSAVSKALRNSPQISRATRLRVQELASRMGYVRDAGLSRLAQYRWKSTARYEEAIGYVLPFGPSGPFDRRLLGTCRRIFRSAGFHFTEYHAPEYPAGRLRDILVARGVRGLVVPRLFDPALARMLTRGDFFCVAIAEGTVLPTCELVRCDYEWCLLDALRRVREGGYRRPALILHDEEKESTLARTLKAIWRSEGLLAKGIVYQHRNLQRSIREALKAYRPDVILSYPGTPLNLWLLEDLGLAPDRQISFQLTVENRGEVPGYFLGRENLAWRAMTYLEGRINGTSRDQTYGRTLLRPEWADRAEPPTDKGD